MVDYQLASSSGTVAEPRVPDRNYYSCSLQNIQQFQGRKKSPYEQTHNLVAKSPLYGTHAIKAIWLLEYKNVLRFKNNHELSAISL